MCVVWGIDSMLDKHHLLRDARTHACSAGTPAGDSEPATCLTCTREATPRTATPTRASALHAGSVRHALAGFILVAFGALAANAPAPDSERDLEAAIHREIVLGDLRGAMADYRAILSRSDKPRPVAARALYQLGECLEKSGQAEEAYNTFRRVTTEYAGETEMASLARVKMTAWSGPRNLRFEEGTVGKLPPGWQALYTNDDYQPQLRHDGCHSKACTVVIVPPNMPKGYGNLWQSFSAAAYRGKTVRLRASLRLEPFLTPTGSLHLPSDNGGDSAQLWLLVEKAYKIPLFSDIGDDQPVRSGDWTKLEIETRIDEEAQVIKFGVMSIGGGHALVDDVSFEVVSQ